MNTFETIQEELEATLDEELIYSEASLSKLKTKELKEILKSHELPVYGTKKVLIERLLDFDSDYDILEVNSTLIHVEKEKDADDSTGPVKGIKV